MKTLIAILLCLVLTTSVFAADYYVSAAGNDANPGTNAAPWQTLGKVNAVSFVAGDHIYLRGGDTFTASLNPNTSGAPGNPIVFSSYGSGRAIINGGNGQGIGISQSNITIDNLNVIGNGRKNGNTASGINVGNSSNVIISNVDVGGFLWNGVELNVNTATITHVNTHDNGFSGIWASGGSDIHISYCTADNNPGCPAVTTNWSGSGIVLGGVNGGSVEYCEASNNGWDMPRGGNGPVGIWAYECNNLTFEYCISHDNKSSPTGNDGGGFDFDGGVTNSTMQYCLSYNNQGAGYGMYEYSGASPWSNNTIRYCVSQNDGTKNGNATMFFWNGGGTFQNARVYNNLFYQNNGNIIGYTDPNSYCPGSIICNNIFVSSSPCFLVWGNTMSYNTVTVTGNCYYNIGGGFNQDGFTDFTSWANSKGVEKINGVLVGINSDPKLTDISTPFTLTDPTKLASLSAFKLLSTSPCIDKGVNLQSQYAINPGTHDFVGNTTPQGSGYDIGVHEFVAQLAAPTGLTAAAASAQASLSWTGSAGAASYNVYRGTVAGGESSTPIATGVVTGNYTDTGLVNGTTYYYTVAAVNNSGTSSRSNEASARPMAGLTIANGVYKIECQASGLDLDDPNGGGVGTATDQQAYSGANQQWTLTAVGGGLYKIISVANGLALSGPTSSSPLLLQAYTGASAQLWSFTANGSYVKVVNAGSGQVMDDFSASPNSGNPVGQWVANGGANQNWSLVAIAPPFAPSGLAAKAGNTQVTLLWTASAGAASYNVYRGTAAAGESATPVATGVTTTSYIDTGLTNGTAYYYKVAAVNIAGTGAMSSEASATATAPFLKTITVSPNRVTVAVNSTQQFAATGIDQYGNPLANQPTFAWSASGGGTFSTGLMTNRGLESGLNSWSAWNSASVTSSNARHGTQAATVGAYSGMFQQINGLTPGATYILTGWAKVQNTGDLVYIGVKNYGGPEHAATISSTNYSQGTIAFTMPAGSTSALVYLWMSAGTGVAYGDDFDLETNGVFKAGLTAGGPFVITATSGGISGSTNVTSRDAISSEDGTASVMITDSNVPVIGSCSATPNPAIVGQPVQFAMNLASDSSGLTCAWDFGDGSTSDGTTSTHTYSVAGSYIAKAQITDPLGASQTVAVPVEITLAVAAKTPLTIQKFAASLSITSPKRDRINFTATIQLPAHISLAQAVTITFGGAQFSTTLNEKGVGKLKNGSVKLTIPKNGSPQVTVSLLGASLAAPLESFGADEY